MLLYSSRNITGHVILEKEEEGEKGLVSLCFLTLAHEALQRLLLFPLYVLTRALSYFVLIHGAI